MLLTCAYMRQQRDELLAPALLALNRDDNQRRRGLTPTLSEEVIHAIALYAQALRDVPQQAGFPHKIVWPTPPPGLPPR